MTEHAAAALALLRDAAQFKWYVIPLLLVVIHLYGEQVAERRWSVVLGALAFWLMDWINEIWNALFFHFNGYAPVWATPGHGSAYVILIGLNLEISFMFLLMGLYAMRQLPADRSLKVMGLPNRWLLAVVNSILCVAVEIVLNRIGALTWDLRFWNAGFPYLVFLIGYLPFFVVGYWVHDMNDVRRQVRVVGVLGAIVVSALVAFGAVLKWI